MAIQFAFIFLKINLAAPYSSAHASLFTPFQKATAKGGT
jgi:hypothetical protein